MNSAVTEIKNLASELEVLAKEIKSRIDNGTDILVPVSEMVTNQARLIFALGEHSSLVQTPVKKSKTTRVVKSGNYLNNYKVRDNRGRYTRV